MTSPTPETRVVWCVYEGKPCSLEDAEKKNVEVFVALEAEDGRFETRQEALDFSLDLMEEERFEVGVLLQNGESPHPWRVAVLEPASPDERRQVVEGNLPGYRWVRIRPPRHERDRALYEMQELWERDAGGRAYAIEREELAPRDITRITLEFRERRVF